MGCGGGRSASAAAVEGDSTTSDDDDDSYYGDNTTTSASPSTAASPYAASPWTQLPGLGGSGAAEDAATTNKQRTGLLGSLVKEGGGHVYSLAAAGDLLYTGTDSRNVRVWRDRRELGGFRSGSGLVKAIVVAADGRIYTGPAVHPDGSAFPGHAGRGGASAPPPPQASWSWEPVSGSSGAPDSQCR